MMLTGVLCLTIISSFGVHTAQSLRARPAMCKPWKIPVQVDPSNHNYHPFFIAMDRCMGQCPSGIPPDHCQCVANKTQKVSVSVAGETTGVISITIENHISCKAGCLDSKRKQCTSGQHSKWDENTCTCNCQISTGNCPAKETWSPKECQCVCNKQTSCPTGMFWNKSICDCTCNVATFTRCSKMKKATNLKTCQCRKEAPITRQVGSEEMKKSETKLVAALVVIGLLLGTLFIIDLVLMCSKKGFIYGIFTKCSERKNHEEFTNQELKNRDGDTGSINDLDIANHAESTLNGNCNHKDQFLTPVTCV